MVKVLTLALILYGSYQEETEVYICSYDDNNDYICELINQEKPKSIFEDFAM